MIEERDVREVLEQQVLDSTDKIEDYPIGSEERKQAVDEVVKLTKARNETYDSQAKAWVDSEKIELEKKKQQIEKEAKHAQAEVDEKRSKLELLKTGILVGGSFIGTFGLHLLENKGVLIKGSTSKWIDKIPWWK